jgi:uncharacterized protein HemX
MSDEIDKEITTKKVTSNPNRAADEYRVSEQRTTSVSNDSSSTGLILGIILTLALGVGASVYFFNNRTITPVLVPNGTNTIKENNSTVIERNNSTTKEVTPSAPQSAPNVEVNVPAPVVPKVEVNIPAPVTPPATPLPTTPSTGGQ